ncbi:hypothetical protein FOMPIDRAFT_1018517 [Fomitopsis schrenkii]|uniref:F-box domain-containing protein n=1 Tax=Fomitopsis schrenkii TaxID=2126942 RepID=S8F5S6_FOMSC|nr:hypothetical protein FOMPIDRAFT_1018517 [Fomitopsis schrenkii]
MRIRRRTRPSVLRAPLFQEGSSGHRIPPLVRGPIHRVNGTQQGSPLSRSPSIRPPSPPQLVSGRSKLFEVNYLDRLPVETFLAVVSVLPVEELQSVSSVCKRFHFIVTPVILKRLGLDTSEAWVFARNTDAIIALAVWCRFLDFKPPHGLIVYISAEEHLAAVECRTLIDFFECPRLRPGRLNTATVTFRGESPSDVMKDVFKAIITSGVEQLHITQQFPSSARAVERSSPRNANAKGRLLFPRLKTFKPDAPFLFDAQFFPWTLKVINGSLIKHLVLKAQPDIGSWSHLLSCMTIPSLCRLTIEGSLSRFTLSNFLDRHPALEFLDIGPHTDPEMHTPTTSSPLRLPKRHRALCRLTTLRAPLSFVAHLIGTARWGTSSSLLNLEIHADIVFPQYPFESSLALVLREISDMEGLIRLVISFPPSVALCGREWGQLPARSDAIPEEVTQLQYQGLCILEVSQNVFDVSETRAFGLPFTSTLQTLLRLFPRVHTLEMKEAWASESE